MCRMWVFVSPSSTNKTYPHSSKSVCTAEDSVSTHRTCLSFERVRETLLHPRVCSWTTWVSPLPQNPIHHSDTISLNVTRRIELSDSWADQRIFLLSCVWTERKTWRYETERREIWTRTRSPRWNPSLDPRVSPRSYLWLWSEIPVGVIRYCYLNKRCTLEHHVPTEADPDPDPIWSVTYYDSRREARRTSNVSTLSSLWRSCCLYTI